MYLDKRVLRNLGVDLSKYLTVGVLNTVVGLLIIFICLYFFRLDDIQSNFIGYCVGIAVSFLLNKHWTFQHRGTHARSALLFGIVVFFSYIANLAVMIFFGRYMKMPVYGAQAIGVITYTGASFVGLRYLAFSTR